jgi:hypothetical protein
MAKPVRRSISRMYSAVSGAIPKRLRKISALTFDDKISANMLMAYPYTIQLYVLSILFNAAARV